MFYRSTKINIGGVSNSFDDIPAILAPASIIQTSYGWLTKGQLWVIEQDDEVIIVKKQPQKC